MSTQERRQSMLWDPRLLTIYLPLLGVRRMDHPTPRGIPGACVELEGVLTRTPFGSTHSLLNCPPEDSNLSFLGGRRKLVITTSGVSNHT